MLRVIMLNVVNVSVVAPLRNYPKCRHSLVLFHVGSSKANKREPKGCTCLGRVFNFKLNCFTKFAQFVAHTNTAEPRLENSAQVLSCQLKFFHLASLDFLVDCQSQSAIWLIGRAPISFLCSQSCLLKF
jgi:hypothetical protein